MAVADGLVPIWRQDIHNDQNKRNAIYMLIGEYQERPEKLLRHH